MIVFSLHINSEREWAEGLETLSNFSAPGWCFWSFAWKSQVHFHWVYNHIKVNLFLGLSVTKTLVVDYKSCGLEKKHGWIYLLYEQFVLQGAIRSTSSMYIARHMPIDLSLSTTGLNTLISTLETVLSPPIFTERWPGPCRRYGMNVCPVWMVYGLWRFTFMNGIR